MSMGAKTPGSETLARTAWRSDPREWRASSCAVMSVDTQANGIHRSSMAPSPRCSPSLSQSLRPRRIEATGSVGSRIRRKPSLARRRSSSGSQPRAIDAPITEPALLPVTASTGMPRRRSSRKTPTAARARAPPPLNTRPIAVPVRCLATRPRWAASPDRRWRCRKPGRSASSGPVDVGCTVEAGWTKTTVRLSPANSRTARRFRSTSWRPGAVTSTTVTMRSAAWATRSVHGVHAGSPTSTTRLESRSSCSNQPLPA